MITTFITAVTETASEILCKHCQKKNTWVTAEILNLCDTRRKLRKKIFEPEGSDTSEQHQVVHEKGKTKLDRRTV